MSRLNDCINDNFEHKYLFPFLWMHGEEHSALSMEIDRIEKCGIKEFCVESRVHDGFCAEKWWDDFGFLLSEAEKRDMKVWLLDDKFFPTGYANNYIADHPELRKKSLKCIFRDYVCTNEYTTVIVPDEVITDSCVSVSLFRREDKKFDVSGEFVADLGDLIIDGLIRFSVPKGIYRVYYIFVTEESIPERLNYIDMLTAESCGAMIKAIYQPHYVHFGKYFGNVFKGFFSDEPCFENQLYTYFSSLGTEDMLIPWSDETGEIISQEIGEEIGNLLAGLWHDIGEKTKLIRHYYMDTVTKLYRRNFTKQLFDWCCEHGVLYVGHVIEDMNTHQRLGYGSGHYFRATEYQSMAGIDVVLHQIVPGINYNEHTMPVCGKKGDPEFFDFMLPKLCQSQSQLNPLTNKRAMCEIFGAFGWAEGVPYMKNLADTMLLNGINRFVPHAFSPKYPDSDCPPHFSRGGKNPQFREFAMLCDYMQRISFLLDGSEHITETAILYNAEGEWNGGKNMLTQSVAKALAQEHVDYEIVWEDILCTEESMRFKFIFVPYLEYIPEKIYRSLLKISENGTKIIFVDGYPRGTVEGDKIVFDCFDEIDLEEIGPYSSLHGIRNLECNYSSVRCGRYITPDGEVVLIKNDSMFDSAEFEMTDSGYVLFDCWNNRTIRPMKGVDKIRVCLAPGEMKIYVQSDYLCDCNEKSLPVITRTVEEFDIILTDCDGKNIGTLKNSTGSNLFSVNGIFHFCGTVSYSFELDSFGGDMFLRVCDFGEIARIYVNGVYVSTLLKGMTTVEISDWIDNGKNKIDIDIIPNLGYAERDFFSQYLALPDIGLKKVEIYEKH